MKEQLCQNRIAAEVLRAYLQTNPPDVDPAAAFASEEKEYLMQAYELLLGKLGTSYAELRIARASTDEKALQRLADRMGVLREDANGPTLEQLLIDLSDPANIVEGEGAADPNDHPKGLEKLFGLRDTVRDVFDGTPESKVEQWKKAKLREDWVKADKLSTPFWRSSAMDREVIIDPDVVTIDDLRHPSNTLVNGDPAPFNIWKKRREWIDAEWAALDGPLPSVTPFSAKAKDVFSADKIIVAFGGALPTTGSALVYTPFGTATNLAFTFASAFQGNGNTYFRVEEDIAEDMFGGTITIGLDVHSNVRPIRNCAAMIERLTGQTTTQYAGAVVQLNWPMNFSAGDVIDTIRPLVAQAASGSQSALTSLKNRHLDLAMAQRFLVLYDQNKAAEQDFETEGGLSQDEWAEFKSIMIQMLKNRLSEAGEVWRTEENSGLLSPIHFRAAIHAPRVGHFPGLKGAVLIDPDQVTERDLPEVTVLHYQNAIDTSDALEVLTARKAELVVDREALMAAHASIGGFQALLNLAFDSPGLIWDVNAESNDYLALLNDLASAAGKGWATIYMTLRLRLTEAELRQVVTLGTKEGNNEVLSQNELSALYNTLNRAHKQLVHLSPDVTNSWVDREDGASQWKFRKAALPLWRASQARRDAWLNALAEHSERPIIDADLIGPAEMKMPEDGNVAYGIFNTRWQQMHGAAEYPDSGAGGWLNEIAAFPLTSTTEFNTVTKQYLGFVEDSLFDIREQEADGTDIRQRIAQLNLTPSEFNRLMACYDLLASASTLTAEEKSIVQRILAQVQKRREFYAYRRAETEAGLTLSQDHFKLREQAIISFPPKPDTPLTQWLAEETDLILWRRMLKGRVEQEKTVLDAWHEALFEVDEAMMVHLRDAMIKAVSPVGQHPVVSARNLGDLLLIDLENNCCYKTNRVAAAIETVQQFLWKTRTGDILANYPDVRYQGEDFDEAWTWMGSYSNWRAAMFVFLYPENVLHPSLRKDQTPAFREVVNGTRNNRRFGPGETCKVAHDYERYLLDLQSMEVACAQQATAYTGTGPCGTANNVARTYEFIFAKAKASGRLYYSITDTNDIAAPKQVRFWGTIPGLEDGDLVIHGCDRYLNNEHGIDHIYLFVTDRKADDKNKFFSLRFSLQTMLWDEGTTQEFEVAVDDLHVHNYDPLRRLLTATGRESNTTSNSAFWDEKPAPGSPNANHVRAYTQSYQYDKLGNIQLLAHQATGNSYNRHYQYTSGKNILAQIDNGANPATVHASFTYDDAGNQLSANTDRHFQWDAADQLRYFKREASGSITSEAHYLYAGGQRIKKFVRNASGGLSITVYIDGVYEHRYTKSSAGTITAQQTLVHVMDGRSRIATLRQGSVMDDIGVATKYNLEDHLGTSTTRLTGSGSVIDREEYYPFGDSSLRTFSSKRYRYVGKELDSESGLYYYGARYYAAWTCRFISVDPLAHDYPYLTPYNYAGNKPIGDLDIDGMQGTGDPPVTSSFQSGDAKLDAAANRILSDNDCHNVGITTDEHQQTTITVNGDIVAKYHPAAGFVDRNDQALQTDDNGYLLGADASSSPAQQSGNDFPWHPEFGPSGTIGSGRNATISEAPPPEPRKEEFKSYNEENKSAPQQATEGAEKAAGLSAPIVEGTAKKFADESSFRKSVRRFTHRVSKAFDNVKSGKLYQGIKRALPVAAKWLGGLSKWLTPLTIAWEALNDTWDAHTVANALLWAGGLALAIVSAPAALVAGLVIGVVWLATDMDKRIDEKFGRKARPDIWEPLTTKPRSPYGIPTVVP